MFHVVEIMNQLRAKYPTGTSFPGYFYDLRKNIGNTNSYDVDKVASSYERALGGTTSITSGCGGWAAFVSDSIFGTTGAPARKVDSLTARPGDIIIVLDNDNKLTHVAIMTKWDTETGLARIRTTDNDSGGTRQESKYVTKWDEYAYTATPNSASSTHIEVWTRYPSNGIPITINSGNTDNNTGSSNTGTTTPSTPSVNYVTSNNPCGVCGKVGGRQVRSNDGARYACESCYNDPSGLGKWFVE